MPKTLSLIRLSLLLGAVALTTTMFFPSQASAVKSCEFYCGKAGPAVCTAVPPGSGLVCTWMEN